MALLLTPELHRSAKLLKVCTAFALAQDLSPADKRIILGKAKAVRLLVEAQANAQAKVELQALANSVRHMTEVGAWPVFLMRYINDLEGVL